MPGFLASLARAGIFIGIFLPAPGIAQDEQPSSISQKPQAAPQPNVTPLQEPAKKVAQPQDTSGLQSRALLSAIDKILKRAAEERQAAKTLPTREKFLLPPIWTETKEEREKSVRKLLDGALEIVTDAPILRMQDEIAKHREAIATLRERLAEIREKSLEAPMSGFLPGILTQTKDTLDSASKRLQDNIRVHEDDIARLKKDTGKALEDAGLTLSKDQLDLLLDSVLGGNLLKLVAAFEVAKIADQRLAFLVKQSNEDLKAARRYFAMHAALFAMLVHAQELLIDRIDNVYLARLQRILTDLDKTGSQTRELLEAQTRDDQRQALEANLKSQDTSRKVAFFYRDYLEKQRRNLADARDRTLFDLKVADNTYETVEESFELRALMDEARTSFEALQRLEPPGFEQIFHNENLKREFENLTQKLGHSS